VNLTLEVLPQGDSMKRLPVVICVLILSACSTTSENKVSFSDPAITQALSGESIIGRPVTSSELPDLDLFDLTDEMKAFAKNAVASAHNQDEQVEMLHRALLSSEDGGRGIRYSLLSTATPIDVFESKKANCLGHSLLFVSMARYLGLNAHVNQVMIPPYWNINEASDNKDSFLLIKHVNVKIKLRKFAFATGLEGKVQIGTRPEIVIDLEMRRFRSIYHQVLLKDDEVAALFYNNRAMEFMAEGKNKDAFIYLKKALSLQSDANFIWSNLGTLYRRHGQMEIAEAVYLKALLIDPSDLTLLNNLAGIYKQMGREAEKTVYQARVKKYRESNPYYLYQMAMRAKEEGRWDQAAEWIIKAISKQKTEERFYRFAAEVYEHQELFDQAKKMQTKADALAALDSDQLQARL
jgi:tetratricopeptide (TPR) repeat protein